MMLPQDGAFQALIFRADERLASSLSRRTGIMVDRLRQELEVGYVCVAESEINQQSAAGLTNHKVENGPVWNTDGQGRSREE